MTTPLGKVLRWTNQVSVLYHQNLETNGFFPLMPPPSLRSDLTFAEGGWFPSQPEVTVGCVVYTHQAWAPVGEDPLAPPPGYALLNLMISKTWHENHTFQLGAQNLLNTPYRNYLDRWRYFADQPGINVYVRYTFTFKKTQTS